MPTLAQAIETGSAIGLLVQILVIGFVVYIASLFPIPAPFKQIILAIGLLAVLVVILRFAGVWF